MSHDAERNDEYAAGLSVGITHDGEAENALAPGVNFTAAYSRRFPPQIPMRKYIGMSIASQKT